MSDDAKKVGAISWTDLTVKDAEGVKAFYEGVVGWKSEGLSMGDYEDFCMQRPADGQTVAGICHAKGVNAKIPPAWLIYITVDDINASVAKVKELGGEVLDGPRSAGGGTMCVIRDPAGAVAGLYQH